MYSNLTDFTVYAFAYIQYSRVEGLKILSLTLK